VPVAEALLSETLTGLAYSTGSSRLTETHGQVPEFADVYAKASAVTTSANRYLVVRGNSAPREAQCRHNQVFRTQPYGYGPSPE